MEKQRPIVETRQNRERVREPEKPSAKRSKKSNSRSKSKKKKRSPRKRQAKDSIDFNQNASYQLQARPHTFEIIPEITAESDDFNRNQHRNEIQVNFYKSSEVMTIEGKQTDWTQRQFTSGSWIGEPIDF